jgi:hypothetical protein
MADTKQSGSVRCVIVTPEQTSLDTQARSVTLPLFDGLRGVGEGGRRASRAALAQQHAAGGYPAAGDLAGHRQEGGGAHPVGSGGHAVDDRVDAMAGDVEVIGRAGAGPEGDADVKAEGS